MVLVVRVPRRLKYCRAEPRGLRVMRRRSLGRGLLLFSVCGIFILGICHNESEKEGNDTSLVTAAPINSWKTGNRWHQTMSEVRIEETRDLDGSGKNVQFETSKV